MHYAISVSIRMTFVVLVLLGLCFVMLLGLLSLIRELFTESKPYVASAADRSETSDSLDGPLSLQSERS